LSKLRAKPARLEFSKTPWAPLDVISVLARGGESVSTVEADGHLTDPDVELSGASKASTTGRRFGAFMLPFMLIFFFSCYIYLERG